MIDSDVNLDDIVLSDDIRHLKAQRKCLQVLVSEVEAQIAEARMGALAARILGAAIKCHGIEDAYVWCFGSMARAVRLTLDGDDRCSLS